MAKIVIGCGILYISEPTLLRDVAQVIVFIPVETEGIKIIKEWLQSNNISPSQRLRESYSTFYTYEEIESPDFDITALQYVLQMVCGDASHEYEYIKPEYFELLGNWKLMISAENWVDVPLAEPTYTYSSIEDRADVIDYLNNIISQRIYYGERTEVAPYDGFMLLWSNSAEAWLITSSYVNPYTHVIDQGKELRLDANEIFAPFPKYILESVCKELLPLPLFSLSMEAKSDKELYMEVDGTIVHVSSSTTLDWYKKQIESIYVVIDKDPGVTRRIFAVAKKLDVYPQDAMSIFNKQAKSFIKSATEISNLLSQGELDKAKIKYRNLKAANWIEWVQYIIGM